MRQINVKKTKPENPIANKENNKKGPSKVVKNKRADRPQGNQLRQERTYDARKNYYNSEGGSPFLDLQTRLHQEQRKNSYLQQRLMEVENAWNQTQMMPETKVISHHTPWVPQGYQIQQYVFQPPQTQYVQNQNTYNP